jgi:hypothetical protein
MRAGRRSARRAIATWLAVCALSLAPSIVHADRVAPLHAHGGTDADRAAVDKALRAALAALGHTSPTDAEVLQGEGAAGSYENQSTGLVAIGKTTGSEWVVDVTTIATPTSAPPGATPKRIEVKACQVSTGRVETLARDVDTKKDLAAQLREMLALMLRPQGVGDDPLPWETPGAASSASASTSTSASSAPSAGADAGAVAAPPEPRFGATHPLFFGVSGAAYDFAGRPDNVEGKRGIGSISAIGGYTVYTDGPIVDVFGRVGSFFGPGPALRLEAGGRALARVTTGVAIGGGATAGVFAETAGTKSTRALFGLDAVVAFALSPRFQIDLSIASLRLAPGTGGALVFLGAELTAAARF